MGLLKWLFGAKCGACGKKISGQSFPAHPYYSHSNAGQEICDVCHDKAVESDKEEEAKRRAMRRLAEQLSKAASSGNIAKVAALLDQGTDVNSWDGLVNGEPGYTPLHRAASNGHEKVVELLLSRGANVNAFAGDGATPLHHASDGGHIKIMKILLAKGGNANAKMRRCATPLFEAVKLCRPSVVELLLNHGADPNITDGHTNRTPLEQARNSVAHEKSEKELGRPYDSTGERMRELEQIILLLKKAGGK